MILRSGKGAILLTTILILSFLALIGLALITLVQSRSRQAVLEIERLQALYLAEAAVAKSVQEIHFSRDLDGNGLGNVKWTPLAGGHFRARHNFQTATITGIGRYNDVRRVVQIQYSPL